MTRIALILAITYFLSACSTAPRNAGHNYSNHNYANHNKTSVVYGTVYDPYYAGYSSNYYEYDPFINRYPYRSPRYYNTRHYNKNKHKHNHNKHKYNGRHHHNKHKNKHKNQHGNRVKHHNRVKHLDRVKDNRVKHHDRVRHNNPNRTKNNRVRHDKVRVNKVLRNVIKRTNNRRTKTYRQSNKIRHTNSGRVSHNSPRAVFNRSTNRSNKSSWK